MIKINEIKKIIVECAGYKYKGNIADNAYDYDCYKNGTTELMILKDDGDIKGCTSDSFTTVASVTANDDSDVTAKDDPDRSIIVSKKTNDDSKLFICSGIFRFYLSIGDDGKISIITPNKEKYIYFPENKYGVYYTVVKLLDDERVSELGSGIRADEDIDAFVDCIHNVILKGLNEAKISTSGFEILFEVIKPILIMCVIGYLKRRLKELKAILETDSDGREERIQEVTELVNSLYTNIKNAQQKLVKETQKAQ